MMRKRNLRESPVGGSQPARKLDRLAGRWRKGLKALRRIEEPVVEELLEPLGTTIPEAVGEEEDVAVEGFPPALEVEEKDWREEWAAAAAEEEEVVEGGWEEGVGGAADAAEVDWRGCWEAAAAEEEVAAEEIYDESATSRRVRRWW